jgi:hypothetical protein
MKRLYRILFIVLCIIVLAIAYNYISIHSIKSDNSTQEGFTVNTEIVLTNDAPIEIQWVNQAINKVKNGYYQINGTQMRKLPEDYTSVSPMPDTNVNDENYTAQYRRNILNQLNGLGYYIAEYQQNASSPKIEAIAMLPKTQDILTLPPNPRTLIPYGYYVVKYRKIENNNMSRAEKDAIAPIERLSKLPYGYIVPYKTKESIIDGVSRKVFETDTEGNYIVEPKTINYKAKTGKDINITYNQYNPLPNVNTSEEKEINSIKENNPPKGFLPDIIEDEVYLIDSELARKINYNVDLTTDYIPPDKEEDIKQAANTKTMTVVGPNGDLIEVPFVPSQQFPTYNQPGSFIYGSSNYVPKYEDSIYLSSTTKLSTLGNVYPTSSSLGGFCNNYKTDPAKLEEKCNSIPTDQCASTSCCVLLGGSKCVYGDDLGPKMKANYSDKFIVNKDVYYYQGKCYGNCHR